MPTYPDGSEKPSQTFKRWLTNGLAVLGVVNSLCHLAIDVAKAYRSLWTSCFAENVDVIGAAVSSAPIEHPNFEPGAE